VNDDSERGGSGMNVASGVAAGMRNAAKTGAAGRSEHQRRGGEPALIMVLFGSSVKLKKGDVVDLPHPAGGVCRVADLKMARHSAVASVLAAARTGARCLAAAHNIFFAPRTLSTYHCTRDFHAIKRTLTARQLSILRTVSADVTSARAFTAQTWRFLSPRCISDGVAHTALLRAISTAIAAGVCLSLRASVRRNGGSVRDNNAGIEKASDASRRLPLSRGIGLNNGCIARSGASAMAATGHEAKTGRIRRRPVMKSEKRAKAIKSKNNIWRKYHGISDSENIS